MYARVVVIRSLVAKENSDEQRKNIVYWRKVFLEMAVYRGRIFELMVGAQLGRTNEQLYYGREGKFEVDYVLKSGSKIFAIEVQSVKKNEVSED